MGLESNLVPMDLNAGPFSAFWEMQCFSCYKMCPILILVKYTGFLSAKAFNEFIFEINCVIY